MVKEFNFFLDFNASFQNVFDWIFNSEQFETKAHIARGNKKITITDWINAGDTFQRVCFFTMVNPDSTGLGDFICMENQKHWMEGDVMKLESTISSDNPSVGGNVFCIHTHWTIKATNHRTDIVVNGTVECKKNIIGFQGMVEGVLLNKVEDSYKLWAAFCQKYVELKIQEEERFFSSGSVQSANRIEAVVEGVDKNAKRGDYERKKLHRRIKKFNSKVVAGTENIVRMFQDAITPTIQTFSNITKTFEKDKESGDTEEAKYYPSNNHSATAASADDVELGLSTKSDKESLKKDKQKRVTNNNKLLCSGGVVVCLMFILYWIWWSGN